MTTVANLQLHAMRTHLEMPVARHTAEARPKWRIARTGNSSAMQLRAATTTEKSAWKHATPKRSGTTEYEGTGMPRQDMRQECRAPSMPARARGNVG